MKSLCVRFAVVLLFCAASQSAVWGQSAHTGAASLTAAKVREIQASFAALFEAMKNGDVAVIEQHSAGPMLNEYKKLLEQNQEYPAFLRNFYKGASFNIVGMTPTPDGDVIVDVAIQLGGGSRSITRLQAKRFDATPPTWKVTSVVRDVHPPQTAKP